jgi:threonine aldolase
LREIADRTPADQRADIYGAGDAIEALELGIAKLLGKEAAVFMPSGTMAQQIALRIHAERTKNRLVAFHPTSHLEIHEQDGYRLLHGLRSVHVGTATRIPSLDDITGLSEDVGTLLLELPQREIGGQLPSWDELVAQTSAARERGMRVHCDGARLWESQPHFGRSLAEIADLFDSVYVSFYKTIGALTGAMLLGTNEFCAEARVWLRRHGGNLYALAPYVLSATYALDDRLPRIPSYVARAKSLAATFVSVTGIEIVPNPPQAHMFHALLHGDADMLITRALTAADRSGIWTFDRLSPTIHPQIHKWEVSVGDATLALDDRALAPVLASILHG